MFQHDERKPTVGHPFRDPETGLDFPFSPTPVQMWQLYKMIQDFGFDEAVNLAILCANLVKHDLTDDDRARIRRALKHTELFTKVLGGTTPLELALTRSYFLLYNNAITREQAADLASDIMKKRVSVESWRKRVDRWAEEQGYPKVQRRKRIEDKTEDIE